MIPNLSQADCFVDEPKARTPSSAAVTEAPGVMVKGFLSSSSISRGNTGAPAPSGKDNRLWVLRATNSKHSHCLPKTGLCFGLSAAQIGVFPLAGIWKTDCLYTVRII